MINRDAEKADYKYCMAKKKKSLGCLFWMALLLMVIVVFLFNQKNIEAALEKTGFLDIFEKRERPMEVIIRPSGEHNQTADSEESETSESPVEGEPEKIVLNITREPAAEDQNPFDVKQTPPETQLKTRKARLFFVNVRDDGGITLKSVIRPVYYGDSPLRETLIALLKGPLASEINQGYLSIIPDTAKIRDVWVEENTAFLDFTENFRFNPLGQVGLQAQVKQVVFTVTEFSNIESVRILIEGKEQDFLSPEGPYIGEPMTRASFQS